MRTTMLIGVAALGFSGAAVAQVATAPQAAVGNGVAAAAQASADTAPPPEVVEPKVPRPDLATPPPGDRVGAAPPVGVPEVKGSARPRR